MGSQARFAEIIFNFFYKNRKKFLRGYTMPSLISHGNGVFSRCFWKILEYFIKRCLPCLKYLSLISHEKGDLLGCFENFLRFFLSRTDGIRKSRCCQRGKILRQNKNSRTVFTARQVRYYVIFFLRVDLFL